MCGCSRIEIAADSAVLQYQLLWRVDYAGIVLLWWLSCAQQCWAEGFVTRRFGRPVFDNYLLFGLCQVVCCSVLPGGVL